MVRGTDNPIPPNLTSEDFCLSFKSQGTAFFCYQSKLFTKVEPFP